MLTAGVNHASERAVFVLIASLGIALVVGGLAGQEGLNWLYFAAGIGALAIAGLRLYRPVVDFINTGAGSVALGFLAIVLPLMGVIIFALYPLAIGFVSSAGIDVESGLVILATASGLLALLNLATLIVNIVWGYIKTEPPEEAIGN